MRWIASGTFRMGEDNAYPEEAPSHRVTVSGFLIDRYAVTDADFANFVTATGYRTVAERPLDPAAYPGADPNLLTPGSAVFFMPTGRVNLVTFAAAGPYVPGACWPQPEGPGSTIEGRERHPVVHVVFEDAEAYAARASKALPTEAECGLRDSTKHQSSRSGEIEPAATIRVRGRGVIVRGAAPTSARRGFPIKTIKIT